MTAPRGRCNSTPAAVTWGDAAAHYRRGEEPTTRAHLPTYSAAPAALATGARITTIAEFAMGYVWLPERNPYRTPGLPGRPETYLRTTNRRETVSPAVSLRKYVPDATGRPSRSRPSHAS